VLLWLLKLPLSVAYLAGSVFIHFTNNTSCKSSRILPAVNFFCLKKVLELVKVLRVANLTSMHGTSCSELSFYTGKCDCQMIAYTPYYMIYTRIRLATMRKNQLTSFTKSSEINYVMTSFEFLLAMRVHQDIVNLFHGNGD